MESRVSFKLSILLGILILFIAPSLYGEDSASPSSAPDKTGLAPEREEKLDVILLMDASGSMRLTDPRRLRDQGASLFLQFLRSDDRVGVIEFSETAKTLRSLSDFSPEKLPEVEADLAKVGDAGTYTDLLAGIQQAGQALLQNARDGATPLIILLSDGKMEPQSGASAASTEKLLNEVLPDLKTKNIKVHTLSFSDEADKDLLSQIALGTDGVNWFTPSVDKVHESFADLFLVVKKPQVVPLTKKGFTIDGEVEEATFYVNREEGASLSLHSPSGKELSLANKPADVKWFQSKKFDVVTVPRPEPGLWQMNGLSVDEGFATVLTNLKLITDWPSSIYARDEEIIQARLFEGVRPVVLPDMSGIIQYGFDITPTDKVSEPIIRELLTDDGEGGDLEAGDGTFSHAITLLEPGEYRLRVRAKGPTFNREQNIPFRVRPPLVTLQVGALHREGELDLGHDEGHEKKGEGNHHGKEGESHKPAKHGSDDTEEGHSQEEGAHDEEREEAKHGKGPQQFEIMLSAEVSALKSIEVDLVATDEKKVKNVLPLSKSHKDPLNYHVPTRVLQHDGTYEVQAIFKAKTKRGSEIKKISNTLVYTYKASESDVGEMPEVRMLKAEEKPTEKPFWGPLLFVLFVNSAIGVTIYIMFKPNTSTGEIVEEYEPPARILSMIEQLQAKISSTEVNISDPRFAEFAEKMKSQSSSRPQGVAPSEAPAEEEE